MLASAKALSASTFDHLDETFHSVTPLNKLAQRLNLRPSYLLLVFFLLTVGMLAAGVFSHLCVTVFGMLYPSYMTFKVAFALFRRCRFVTVSGRRSGWRTGSCSVSSLPSQGRCATPSSSCQCPPTTCSECCSTCTCSTQVLTAQLSSTTTTYVAS